MRNDIMLPRHRDGPPIRAAETDTCRRLWKPQYFAHLYHCLEVVC